MRYAESWRQAVVALDMAAYNDLVSLEEQAEFFTHQNGWTGIPKARKALGIRGLRTAGHRRRTVMRLVWEVDAELPRPLCNVPIFDLDGRHLGTPDLLDLETGLMGEYDGPGHLTRVQHARDVQRAELLRSHDLESVIMMADDFGHLGPLSRATSSSSGGRRSSAAGSPYLDDRAAVVVDAHSHRRRPPRPDVGPAGAFPQTPLGLTPPSGVVPASVAGQISENTRH